MTNTNMAGFRQPNDWGMHWGNPVPQPNQFNGSGMFDSGENYGGGVMGAPSFGSMQTPGMLGSGTYGTSMPTIGIDGVGSGNDWFSKNSMFGDKNGGGWAGTALGVAQGIGNAFMGMKQYGLAKDQLAASKKQFETNFAAQKGLTNANLEDRQRARIASNAGAYQSVGDYMNKNGVK